MKRPLLALVSSVFLLAPASLAQAFPSAGNHLGVGLQGNFQTGAYNQASNSVQAEQTATARAPRLTSAPFLSSGMPGLGGEGARATPLFGDGPLVSNNIAIGTQINAQIGDGNEASNTLVVGQSGSASSPRGGRFGGLVEQNVAVGSQVNVQNGFGNSASNAIFAGQSGSAGRVPMLTPTPVN